MLLEVKIVDIIAKRNGKVLVDLEWRILCILFLNPELFPNLGGETCFQLVKGIFSCTCDLCTFLHCELHLSRQKILDCLLITASQD